MSRVQTILSRQDFLQAHKSGEKALSRGLVIQAVIRDADMWRVGFTASKKIGNAVCRNRARRRMRALVRLHLVPMAHPGVDYVLIARHDTNICDWQDLVTGMEKAIKYLHYKLSNQTALSS